MRTLTSAFVAATAFLLSAVCFANPGYYGIVWSDDMDSGPAGWTHEDLTVSATTVFHIDSYYAFDDPAVEDDHSWWCGHLDSGYSGGDGYGNGWDQRLELPPIPLSTGVTNDVSWGAVKALFLTGDGRPERHVPTSLPVLTFAYRHDSEPGYDFTYVEAQVNGAWTHLHDGYTGSSSGWIDLGTGGFDLSECDDPLRIRFRVLSDWTYSDEDGLFDSDAGAFHVDNVRVYDALTGNLLLMDDCEGSSPCTPTVPGAAGDYWHIVDRLCPAWSDPCTWWCGDDADTSHIPPGLANALYSPPVELELGYSWPCTLHYLLHAEVPAGEGDWWDESVTFDGGLTWHSLGGWWGDFGQCAGWGTHGFAGVSLDELIQPGVFQFRLTFYTDDDGCGPGTGGGAGLFLDDVWLLAMFSPPWPGVDPPALGPLASRILTFDAERYRGR